MDSFFAKIRKPFILLLCFSGATLLFADYPVIEQLDSFYDSGYRQQQQDVELFYKSRGSSDRYPELLIFQYRLKEKDTLFSLASSFNITYETIATLNNMDDPDDWPSGGIILIPNMPGVFVNIRPRSDFQDFVSGNTRSISVKEPVTVFFHDNTFSYEFYPGDVFQNDERRFFLGGFFHVPLKNYSISSRFGYRIHPITGEWSLHSGLDYDTAEGQDVYPAGSGVVSETGYSSIYGYYILIDHERNLTTMYAHLSEISANKGDKVSISDIIGKTGNSGMSTGPHLHFEIRKDGQPVNPELYLIH